MSLSTQWVTGIERRKRRLAVERFEERRKGVKD